MHLLSTSAPHASSWLLVTLATGLDLHLEPNELQTAVKWWLGVDAARETSCYLCPDTALDRLENHAATCKHGGDVVSRHNRLRDQALEFCRRAHQVEKGSGLTPDHSRRTRPEEGMLSFM